MILNVMVHFAFGGTRAVLATSNQKVALNEALHYTSDAKAVWIDRADGTREWVKPYATMDR